MKENETNTMSKILLLCLGLNTKNNEVKKLNPEKIYHIFQTFGQLKTIVIFSKASILKCFIEFESVESSVQAKYFLHNQFINNLGKARLYFSNLEQIHQKNEYVEFWCADEIHDKNQYRKQNTYFQKKIQLNQNNYEQKNLQFYSKALNSAQNHAAFFSVYEKFRNHNKIFYFDNMSRKNKKLLLNTTYQVPYQSVVKCNIMYSKVISISYQQKVNNFEKNSPFKIKEVDIASYFYAHNAQICLTHCDHFLNWVNQLNNSYHFEVLLFQNEQILFSCQNQDSQILPNNLQDSKNTDQFFKSILEENGIKNSLDGIFIIIQLIQFLQYLYFNQK